jgi:sugar O-acyltransferase (sialic acid O-acetyltransferase NeuD family)
VERLVIYGAGGFGRELLLTARAEKREIAFLTDGDPAGGETASLIGFADLTPDDEVVVAVADPLVRRRLAGRLSRFGKLIGPTALMGADIELGEGAIICDFAAITASARIGRHFQLNGYSYVAHDCVIGDFVTIGPRVSCNGNVHIGDGAMVGCGAVIRNGTADAPLVIGEGAVIGMGAVVTRSVAPGSIVAGNPARTLPPRPMPGH